LETEHSHDVPLPEGYYYHDQLIGLQVKTVQGELIGTITGILTGKSNDNYIVHGSRGEVLIPAIEDVVQSIDLKKGNVIIEPMEGLLELNVKKPPK
jgi:16S rRNA processing protein RimM